MHAFGRFANDSMQMSTRRCELNCLTGCELALNQNVVNHERWQLTHFSLSSFRERRSFRDSLSIDRIVVIHTIDIARIVGSIVCCAMLFNRQRIDVHGDLGRLLKHTDATTRIEIERFLKLVRPHHAPFAKIDVGRQFVHALQKRWRLGGCRRRRWRSWQ